MSTIILLHKDLFTRDKHTVDAARPQQHAA